MDGLVDPRRRPRGCGVDQSLPGAGTKLFTKPQSGSWRLAARSPEPSEFRCGSDHRPAREPFRQPGRRPAPTLLAAGRNPSHASTGGQPRQKRSRPRVNVRDQDWIERPIKAHLLGGGSRNRESAAPLQQIGVPAAENRPQRVWLECVSDEVAANRESAGQALALHFNFTRPGAGGQYCVRRFEPSTRGLHDQGICARANGLSRGLLPGFPLSSPGRRSVTRPSGRAGR